MMRQEDLHTVLAFITPGILHLLMERRGLAEEEAASLLYNSEMYRTLEDEESKLWRLSYPILYDLLDEELTTGKITWPEEQL
ncbi:MAG: hypothetical protein LBU39_01330 [Desulfobulbaceae bacterium]|jgi:hypothetical protein|nr:hypothetical protein [Desulfobulbaceae bacterium]